jgi:hypothetical protein
MGALSELDNEFYSTLHHSQMRVAGSNFVTFNINVEKVKIVIYISNNQLRSKML